MEVLVNEALVHDIGVVVDRKKYYEVGKVRGFPTFLRSILGKIEGTFHTEDAKMAAQSRLAYMRDFWKGWKRNWIMRPEVVVIELFLKSTTNGGTHEHERMANSLLALCTGSLQSHTNDEGSNEMHELWRDQRG
jgi:hypothetical protein